MSFTAEVKNELSHIEPKTHEERVAELSGLIRVCGHFARSGQEPYSIRCVTETSAVARTLFTYIPKTFDLKAQWTPRKSHWHHSNNYLIEIPWQPALDPALKAMGIVSKEGELSWSIPQKLIRTHATQAAFIRGVFLGAGYIAHPSDDFHLEVSVARQVFAEDLIVLLHQMNIRMRINERRGNYVIYSKNYAEIVRLLHAMGATLPAKGMQNARRMNSVKNNVNRMVNAEIANAKRVSEAAARQLAVVAYITRHSLLEELTPELQQFCELRSHHPEFSLTELGRLSRPALSKATMHRRFMRLLALAQKHGYNEAVCTKKEFVWQ